MMLWRGWRRCSTSHQNVGKRRRCRVWWSGRPGIFGAPIDRAVAD